MAFTTEIIAREWGAFLSKLSERNQGRPVRIEVAVPPGEGEPMLAEHRPLRGVEYEKKTLMLFEPEPALPPGGEGRQGWTRRSV
jgi:hypothetical protein